MNHDRTVELQGHCPVGYHVAGQALLGNADFSCEHNGRLYYFVSADAQAAFEKNPDRFLPAFDGKCAFGISIEKEFQPCPKNFKLIDGRLHLFVKNDDTDARELWNKEEVKCIASANKYWQSEYV